MDLKHKKVGVLYGGLSSEAQVSKMTGAAFIKALELKGHTAIGIEVGKDIVQKLLNAKVDVVMNGLHGKMAEDGCIQGLLEWMGIPYTGSGVMASAIAMNKIISKKLFTEQKIPTPKYREYHLDRDDFKTLEKKIKGPVVVKAQAEGSTVGTTIVNDKKNLLSAINEASKHDSHILIEEFIEGPEVTCSIVNAKAYSLIEIVPKSGFYDYHSKYTKGATEYIIPARISKKTTQRIQKYALSIYQLFQCRGCVRVDFMVDKKGVPWVMEANTLPGMTETSLVPKACAYDGLEFNDLVEQLLLGAALDHEKIYAS